MRLKGNFLNRSVDLFIYLCNGAFSKSQNIASMMSRLIHKKYEYVVA
jgi:hypothetical protein